MNKFFSILGAIVAGLFMAVLTAFVQGFVLMNLWNWFIAPLGVMKIGLARAFGLALTIRVFINTNSNESEDKDSNVWVNFFATIIGYLILWGVGALIVLFI